MIHSAKQQNSPIENTHDDNFKRPNKGGGDVIDDSPRVPRSYPPRPAPTAGGMWEPVKPSHSIPTSYERACLARHILTRALRMQTTRSGCKPISRPRMTIQYRASRRARIRSPFSAKSICKPDEQPDCCSLGWVASP